jgi:hypothetical protein
VLGKLGFGSSGEQSTKNAGDSARGPALENVVNNAFPGAGALASSLSNGADVARFGLPGGAASPRAAAAISSSVSSSKVTTSINAPISITVPPGTDAAGVAEAARQAVREELVSHFQDAHAANMGN